MRKLTFFLPLTLCAGVFADQVKFRNGDIIFPETRSTQAEAVYPATARKMYESGKKHLGKNYDWVFGWSDEKIYCSELVRKIYKEGLGIELSPPKKLKEFNLADKIVQKKMRERYGKKIPYEELVVSPGQLFDSPLLETVYSH